MKRNTVSRLIFAALLLVLLPFRAGAITMVSSSFDSLCAKSSARLYAKVVRQELVPPQGAVTVPRMCYELQVIQQLDARPALAGNPRICYLGDTQSADKKLVVGGLHYPVVGETGVFLVSALNDTAVISPLQGYNQGHFTVRPVKGRNLVYTAAGKAVCGFNSTIRSHALDGEAADGLLLDAPGKRCQPMPLEAFVEKVRQCRP